MERPQTTPTSRRKAALRDEEPARHGRDPFDERLTARTVGDLIAAAFDVLGDVQDVARLLASPPLSRRVHRRIVLV